MNPLVSICCITYNHEDYIAEALESFISQKTSFDFEILVHDDASTDNTSLIIRELHLKYPDIIKPIFQMENQYSKGTKINFEILWPIVNGKYIAMCEGDDYWTDSSKLQKQVDFMENNSSYSMCYHAVELVDVSGKSIGRRMKPEVVGNAVTDLKDNVKGGVVHISSVLLRSRHIEYGMPNWAKQAKHGDYALALFFSACGKTYFIDETMSSHRIGVENSAMTLLKKNYSISNEINYHYQRIETLDQANEYFKYKYDNDITEVKKISEMKILLLENNYKEIVISHRNFLKTLGIAGTTKFFLVTKFPKYVKTLSKFKKTVTKIKR